MIRQTIQEPITQTEWDKLPQEFIEFLDSVDEARDNAASSAENYDTIYPSYDYEWNIDSGIPFATILYYWNSENELPDPKQVIKEIQEGMEESAFDDCVASFYSY